MGSSSFILTVFLFNLLAYASIKLRSKLFHNEVFKPMIWNMKLSVFPIFVIVIGSLLFILAIYQINREGVNMSDLDKKVNDVLDDVDEIVEEVTTEVDSAIEETEEKVETIVEETIENVDKAKSQLKEKAEEVTAATKVIEKDVATTANRCLYEQKYNDPFHNNQRDDL